MWRSSLLALAGIVIAFCLYGCGQQSNNDTTSTTTPVSNATTTTVTTTVTTTSVTSTHLESLYSCKSQYTLPSTKAIDRKGLALDDTTFQKCANETPALWPNTNQPVTSIRTFKSWEKDWNEDDREGAWASLLNLVHRNGAKVLVGTQVTCSRQDDDEEWALTLKFLKRLGPDHVMAVAVGNEMELFFQKVGVTPDCVNRLWVQGEYWKLLVDRMKDLDANGFTETKLTSVFGAYSLAHTPFLNDPTQGLVASFLKNASSANETKDRWVFNFNIYPFWEVGSWPKDQCETRLKGALSYAHTGEVPMTAKVFRQRIKMVTGKDDDTFWVAETGWSSPAPGGFNSQCLPEATTLDKLATYYSNFMDWDLTVDDDIRGPDHFFYFTMRDADNFNNKEGFGLIHGCGNISCKVQQTPGEVAIVV